MTIVTCLRYVYVSVYICYFVEAAGQLVRQNVTDKNILVFCNNSIHGYTIQC